MGFGMAPRADPLGAGAAPAPSLRCDSEDGDQRRTASPPPSADGDGEAMMVYIGSDGDMGYDEHGHDWLAAPKGIGEKGVGNGAPPRFSARAYGKTECRSPERRGATRVHNTRSPVWPA